MRIIYTNLKMDDGGVKKSMRQLRVEFAGAPKETIVGEAATAPAEPSWRGATPRASRPPEGSDAPDREMPTPVAQGISSLRAIFIRKFIDAQRRTDCEQEELGFSVTI